MINKSKLFKLKEWLTVPEAASHLTTMFGEEVSEADVLRLALDGHLILSVNFVNQAYGKCGKLISCDDKDNLPKDFFSALDNIPKKLKEPILAGFKNLGPFPDHYLDLDDNLTTIEGVWDLSMLAGQKFTIEHECQRLTGGPPVSSPFAGATFVTREGGQVCRLYQEFDEETLDELQSEKGKKDHLKFYGKSLKEKIFNNEIDEKEAEKLFAQREKNLNQPRNYDDDYFPAGWCLPDDSILVVRTQALIDLQESLSSEEPTTNKTQSTLPPLNPAHPFHAKELKISIEAWSELYENNPPLHTPSGGHKKYIEKWLEERHPELGARALGRISTIINPNSKGGASPIK